MLLKKNPSMQFFKKADLYPAFIELIFHWEDTH